MADTGLQDQIALVTGAASGLGAAIARRLAAEGAHLVVNDLRADAAEVVAKEVDGEVAAFDVADSAAFDAAVDGVVERHGHLDVLVNNAGILNDRPEVMERLMAAQMAALTGEPVAPVRCFSSLTDEQFDRMIRTHVYGTFNGMRAALRHMETARSGSIVNLCSIYSHRGSVATPEYAAAKHAIAGLTRSVGAEVAPLGIRVNAVAPGFIDTPLLDPMDEAKPFLVARIPAGRLGQAEEVADLVRYLVCDASYSFGEILPVSGGWLVTTIFTRIIDGEIPGRFVWRDEDVVAFLPIALLAPGHTLVVPIEPVDHWIDLSPTLNDAVWRVAQTISRALDAVYHPSKVGVLVVGEEVPHAHVHLVPFTDLRQLSFANQDPDPAPEALDDQARALRGALRAAGAGDAVPPEPGDV